MELTLLIKAFTALGHFLLQEKEDAALSRAIEKAYAENQWFTPKNSHLALNTIARYYLDPAKINQWLSRYKLLSHPPANIGLIMAGNIPLAGWHDLMAVLASGNKAQCKLSSKDKVLPEFMISKLISFEPALNSFITIADKLHGFDAVIATGSGNTARYFDYYFGKYPHIIRQNRTSVAVLKGNETAEDWALLGEDIFTYFGLGCRNVSHLFVPDGYDFTAFYQGIESFKNLADFKKYNNNYEYHRSLLLLDSVPHLDNGFLILKQDTALESPVASLFYSYFSNEEQLREELASVAGRLQCVVSKNGQWPGSLPFGEAQRPELWQYADGVDTMEFLTNIKIR